MAVEKQTKGSGARAGDTRGAAEDAGDRLRDGAEKTRAAFQDHVVEPAKRAGAAMKESGERVAETSKTVGLKLLDQAEQNAQQAFNAMRAAAGAKDISEVIRIQSEFLREQGNRSMAQAREVGELIMQFGRDAVAPLRGDKDDRRS